MKFLNDYFSLSCFLIAWILSRSIYTATTVGIISSGLQLVVMWCIKREWKAIRFIFLTFALWGVFGGLTLFFHNQHFIQWKPTILYWAFAIAFAGSQLFTEKGLYQRLLEEKITLPKHVWHNLNHSWVFFFIILGALNIWVAYSFSLQTWVYYKIFGSLVLTFLIVVGQAIYMHKYIEDDTDNGNKLNTESA